MRSSGGAVYTINKSGEGRWQQVTKGKDGSVSIDYNTDEEISKLKRICSLHTHNHRPDREVSKSEKYEVHAGPSFADFRAIRSVKASIDEQNLDNAPEIIGAVHTSHGMWYHQPDRAGESSRFLPSDFPNSEADKTARTEFAETAGSYIRRSLESKSNTEIDNFYLSFGVFKEFSEKYHKLDKSAKVDAYTDLLLLTLHAGLKGDFKDLKESTVFRFLSKNFMRNEEDELVGLFKKTKLHYRSNYYLDTQLFVPSESTLDEQSMERINRSAAIFGQSIRLVNYKELKNEPPCTGVWKSDMANN
ncbi:MAG: hypothetical protein ACI9VM_000805 [Candidatus Azotimanducaceae bacterium]|jgi:hypothetical protein